MEARLMITTGILFCFGALLIAFTHKLRKFDSSLRKADWNKYGIYLIIVISLLLSAYLDRYLTAAILAAIAIGGSLELYSNLRNQRNLSFGISLPLLLVPILCLGHLLLGSADTWFFTFTFVFLLVATTDSFSQLWGKLLGSHKLCPYLSPGKTWEGLLGGFASTAAVSLSLKFLLPHATAPKLVGLGLIIATSATIGDLLFSYIKRKIGIKDFSELLPGHGGVLDRFDSLIVTAPVFYWTKLFLLK